MGSGKTTVGKVLSNALGYSFSDRFVSKLLSHLLTFGSNSIILFTSRFHDKGKNLHSSSFVIKFNIQGLLKNKSGPRFGREAVTDVDK